MTQLPERNFRLKLSHVFLSHLNAQGSPTGFLLQARPSMFSSFLKRITVSSTHLFYKVLGFLWLLAKGFLLWEGSWGQVLSQLDL